MTALVIDTSVAVKWFSRETDTPAALELRDRLFRRDVRLLAPDILLYELANALRFNPRFSADDVKEAVDSVSDLGLEFRAADADLLRQAAELAFRFNVTVYDAAFLALANLSGFNLLSADEKLIARAAGFPRIFRLGEKLP